MRILITGITGFVGGHLTEALLARSHGPLFGVSREGEWSSSLQHLTAPVTLFQADLCDRADLLRLLEQIRPEQIYHLAGHADVGQSFRQPELAWRDNLTATQCLYDAVHAWGGQPRILFVGSGLVYGEPRTPEQVFDEEDPFYPVHPYASSKAAADLMSYQYTRFPGLAIVRARPFNHIGPRQSPQYAVAHFAKQIAAIEKGVQEPCVATGNLEAQRDLTDVRDVVQAYIALMERGHSGAAYNVASEQLHTMDEVLRRLLDMARVRVEVRRQEHLARASEPFRTRASAARLRDLTGWKPAFTLTQSLADILDYWRSHTGAPT